MPLRGSVVVLVLTSTGEVRRVPSFRVGGGGGGFLEDSPLLSESDDVDFLGSVAAFRGGSEGGARPPEVDFGMEEMLGRGGGLSSGPPSHGSSSYSSCSSSSGSSSYSSCSIYQERRKGKQKLASKEGGGREGCIGDTDMNRLRIHVRCSGRNSEGSHLRHRDPVGLATCA